MPYKIRGNVKVAKTIDQGPFLKVQPISRGDSPFRDKKKKMSATNPMSRTTTLIAAVSNVIWVVSRTSEATTTWGANKSKKTPNSMPCERLLSVRGVRSASARGASEPGSTGGVDCGGESPNSMAMSRLVAPGIK